MKQLNNINAIWGQVEQPKTSNNKITYHGNYHTFGDIDTSQFTDEVLVWHRPEFPKKEWRYGLYGIKSKPIWNYVEEEGMMTIELQTQILISLTSIKIRYDNGSLFKTLDTLFNQKTKYKYKIIMNISKEPYLLDDGYDDSMINNLKNKYNSIIIQVCSNYGSLRKIIPTLKKYKNAIIITVDDDIIYPEDFVEKFVNNYYKYKCIIGGVTRVMPKNLNSNIDIDKDLKHYKDSYPSINVLPEGYGGILYHSSFFDQKFINLNFCKFPEKIKQNDDVLLKVYTYNKNIKVVYCNHNIIDTRPEVGLWYAYNKNNEINFYEVLQFINNVNKYIYIQSTNGFTDILCIIFNVLKYAEKYNRIVLVDGINSVYKINFSNYFTINHNKIICDYNKIIELTKNKTIYPNELHNKLDLILQGIIKFRIVKNNNSPIHSIKYNEIELTIPDKNPIEDIIINSQSGFDTWNSNYAFKIFNLFSMKPILKTYCQNNYKNLPKPYLSIHIRNTDYQCDYKNIYYENKDQIHQYKTIYIATDDKNSLDFFKQQGLNIYNFTTFPNIQSDNLHKNEEISGDIKIKDLISDLYIMALSDMLLSNSKGGFIHLARECFNNKDLIKDKFK